MENFTQFEITPNKSWADIQEEEEQKQSYESTESKKNLNKNNVNSSKCNDERNKVKSKQ